MKVFYIGFIIEKYYDEDAIIHISLQGDVHDSQASWRYAVYACSHHEIHDTAFSADDDGFRFGEAQ